MGGVFLSLSVKEPASLGCWLICSLVSSQKLGTFSFPNSRGGLEERPPKGGQLSKPGKAMEKARGASPPKTPHPPAPTPSFR